MKRGDKKEGRKEEANGRGERVGRGKGLPIYIQMKSL